MHILYFFRKIFQLSQLNKFIYAKKLIKMTKNVELVYKMGYIQ